ILLRAGEQTSGQQDLPGDAVTQDPEDLVADVGLQGVDGQDDAALLLEQGAQAVEVGRGQGAQFVVAVQEVGDGTLGHDHAAAGGGPVDLRGAARFGGAGGGGPGGGGGAEPVAGEGRAALRPRGA